MYLTAAYKIAEKLKQNPAVEQKAIQQQHQHAKWSALKNFIPRNVLPTWLLICDFLIALRPAIAANEVGNS